MGNVFSGALPETGEELAAEIFATKQKEVLSYTFVPLVTDCVLLGVFLMQVYSYFTYQRSDTWWTKGPVIALTILSLIYSGFHICLFDKPGYVQRVFVENFGKWAIFFRTDGAAWAPTFDALTSGIVQCFMSYRAYRLNNRAIWIPIAVAILCLTSIGAAMSVTIIFFNLDTLIDAPKVFEGDMLWAASIMTADLIITITIIYGLSKSKTGWTRTDKTITKLVRMTLESQLPPLIIAVAFVIEFSIEPSNLLGALLQHMQSKFYAVGMMYSINARMSFQRKMESDRLDPSGQVFAMSGRRTQPTQIQVAVETETHVQQPRPYGQSFVAGDVDGKKDYEDSLEDGQKDHHPEVFNSSSHLTHNQFLKN